MVVAAINWWGKQRDVLAFARDDCEALYCVGPTQSGKSYPLAESFTQFVVGNQWPELGFDGFAVLGPRQTQARMAQNNIAEACERLAIPFRPYTDVRRPGLIGPQPFHLFSASEADAEMSFRGLSLGGMLVEEATLLREDIFKAAEGRALHSPYNGPPAKHFVSTNPDNPYHWFKRRRVDTAGGLNARVLDFTYDDNPIMDEARRERLRKRWVGPMLRRMYYGEWAAHGGLVWPNFAEKALQPPPDEKVVEYHLAIDHATATVTHALLMAMYIGGHRRVVGEWRHDGRESGYLSNGDQCRRIRDELLNGLIPTRVYVDPAALHFRLEAEKHLGEVWEAVNDVLPGCQQVALWLDGGHLTVDRRCTETITECAGYSWDEKRARQGEDRPLKVDDHAPDTLRYYCLSEARLRQPRSYRYAH